MRKNLKYSTLLILMIAALSWSCRDKKETEPTALLEPNELTNKWILNVMSEVYYWVSDLGKPIDMKSDPEDFFEALLYRPTDRFSIIYPDYQELINALSGISLEAGYEIQLYRASASSNAVIAEISYIKKNSPAALAGLKRGDRIQKINGQEMNLDNFRDLLDLRSKQHTISFISFDDNLGGYVAKPDVSLNPIQLAENPNFLDSIYTIENQKIGYVVYHFFAPGTGEGNTSYDQEMDAIFANFKSNSINHLVLDFRYNGGGYVSSAVNLASLIAPGANSTSIFSKTKYNAIVTAAVPELKDAKTTFKSKTQNLGNILTNNKVYVLTSSRTASASELIINGLKPYMDVVIIGDKTTGKNVGSIALEDEKNPSNKYGLLPIVSQSFNSLDQSDYSTGFEPNITLKESSEILRQLGDINELLLRTAISQITGKPATGRYLQLERQDIGSTLDSKVHFGHQIEALKLN